MHISRDITLLTLAVAGMHEGIAGLLAEMLSPACSLPTIRCCMPLSYGIVLQTLAGHEIRNSQEASAWCIRGYSGPHL